MGDRVSLDDVRRALARIEPRAREDVPLGRKAAVAGVFRDRDAGLELLFIRRAEHPKDPWSGNMGWPGGRVDAGDGSPLLTAVRETREELALDLERDADLLGALSERRTHLRVQGVPLAVAAFLFALRGDPVLSPNYEVQETVWVPLSYLLDRSNRGLFVWTGRGLPLPLPCYRYEGRVIWGLTLGLLDELLDALGSAR
ncbi:MAG: CoA pyrophosphatase [Acidobacteria bacterium]|nr:CoA pyrophosphatase [Acidobacteriota bacterium]